MSKSFDGLPQVLRDIAEVAGLEAALTLAERKGGTEVKIPAKLGPTHWLVGCVGAKAAAAICKHYRVIDADDRAMGVRLLVPRGPTGVMAQAKTRLARALHSGDFSVREAARHSGLTERTAWRMKARIRQGRQTDQGELF